MLYFNDVSLYEVILSITLILGYMICFFFLLMASWSKFEFKVVFRIIKEFLYVLPLKLFFSSESLKFS